MREKTVKQIKNRKAPALGKLKGKAPEERKIACFNHFKNLLGTPDTSLPPEDIPLLFSKVNIIYIELTIKVRADP